MCEVDIFGLAQVSQSVVSPITLISPGQRMLLLEDLACLPSLVVARRLQTR